MRTGTGHTVCAAAAMLASAAATALTLTFTHPYGELVDRGSVHVRIESLAPWDCTTSFLVNPGTRQITINGGAAMGAPGCSTTWDTVLPALAMGRYTVTGNLVAASGSVVETATQTIEILPVEGRCNAVPGLVPTMWGVHKSMRPIELWQKVQEDPAYAASLGNPIVGSSNIVSTEYHREFATLTYPPLENPTAINAKLLGSGEFLGTSVQGYGCFSAAPPDATSDFVEFYHAGLDHYFYTGDAGEIAAIDAGKVGAWTRTGQSFRAVTMPGCPLSTTDTVVYRFAGRPGSGPSSHFFTRDRAECYVVDKSGQWDLEGVPMWATPVAADGSCPAPYAQTRVPLYRVWRPFGDSNHRFTTKRAVVDEMVAKGWVDEGPAMCVLPSS